MCTISGHHGGRLRVTQAYIALLSIPGSGCAPKAISVARIGNCEIRMSNGSPSASGDVPSVWIELFDHDARLSIDGCSCREIEEAVAAFDLFMAQAKALE
jgi:hypothetical protein